MFIYTTCRPLSCAQYYARDAAAAVAVLCSPFVRSLKTLSESHVYDFCMYVSCVCHRDVVVVFLRFFFYYYFTLLNFTFAVVAAAAVALYIIRDDDANEQLFFALCPLSLFYFCSFMCVRACLCAPHGCAISSSGWGFSPHLFRLTLVSTQYYLILSLFAEIVSVSFFCFTLFSLSLHSIPTHLCAPRPLSPHLFFSLRYIHTDAHTHTYTHSPKTVPVNVYVYCYCWLSVSW